MTQSSVKAYSAGLMPARKIRSLQWLQLEGLLQASCNSGIGRRIDQAVGGWRQDWEHDVVAREQSQAGRVKRMLLPGAAALLLASLAWSSLGLAAFVVPRQRALAAGLIQTAGRSTQTLADLQSSVLDLQYRWGVCHWVAVQAAVQAGRV